MGTIVKKLKEYLAYKGVSVSVAEKEIGLSNGTLSKPFNTGTTIKTDTLEKFLKYYDDINPEWLLVDKGTILKESDLKIQLINNDRKTKDVIQISQEIPLYSLEAAASVVALFNDYSSFQPIDTIKIPNLSKCDGAIYVTGDSMYPLLKSGDIVAFKEVPNIANSIYYGEMYIVSVIIEDDYYTIIKFIQKSEKGEEYVKLVSQNKHHQDKDVLIADIKALAIVKASVRLNTM